VDPLPDAAPAPRSASLPMGLLKGTRPKQWVKNILVFAAPAAAGVVLHPRKLGEAILAFVVFTMAAGGTYLINDARDVEADRVHPKKKFRPIAAGIVPVKLAWVVGIGLMVLAPTIGGLVTGWRLAVVLGGYVILQLAYSTWLKHIAVVELVCVAFGFVLRALAGAEATHVYLSSWFVIVASFGSLFMVLGKRYAEATGLEDGGVSARKILSEYPVTWLRQMRDTCVAVTLLAYCLFAFERAAQPVPGQSSGKLTLPWYELSILPVTVGLLSYALRVEKGDGGAPEDLVLHDPVLLLSGLAWAVLFGLGVARV
jgi:decaprenyl-phosphate phosphoribosyltransferase